MFKFWEYQITFKDPAAVYSYHLISVHHSVIWYLIIILILVYYWLLMIIRDFNWESYNRSQISLFLIFIVNISLLFNNTFFKRFNKDIIDMKYLSWLGAESSWFFRFFSTIYLNFYYIIFGYQCQSISKYDSNIIDIYGRVFFDDEIVLFDYTMLLHENVNDLLFFESAKWDNWKVSPKFSDSTDPSFITWFYYERLVSFSLYHYTASAFFFNGYVNKENFGLRKISKIDNNSDLGLKRLLSLIVLPYIIIYPVVNSNKSNNYNVLSDTLFESFDFKHSLSFEIIWALFPTSIIVSILIPSLYLLYSLDEDLDPKFTIKVIGNQWYWSYEFANWVEVGSDTDDNCVYLNYKFDSNLIPVDDLKFGTKRLLEVDNRLHVPTNITLRFLITANDVLHSWAVPELGIKIDAVPGRLNQFLAFIIHPGVFYGQCSEICGSGHGFMPIVVEALSYDKFQQLVVESNS